MLREHHKNIKRIYNCTTIKLSEFPEATSQSTFSTGGYLKEKLLVRSLTKYRNTINIIPADKFRLKAVNGIWA